MPYPRSQQHPKTSVSSVNSVGELTHPPICVDQCNPWENYIPTEPTEPTEASCREGSPTDITDAHRLGGYGILPCPRSHKCNQTSVSSVNSVGELTQPTICVDQCNPWENCIPTEPTERTEASCREKSPTDITDAHRCRRVWHPAVPTQPLTQPNFCEFCGFRGRTNATNHLC